MRENTMSLRVGVTLFVLALLGGCADKPAAPPAGGDAKKADADDAGHTHVRDKMLLADAGEYHAALTAHLSPQGNELDIFFETTDDKPAPVAIPSTKLTAFARNIGEGEPRELVFEPAPADERPKGEKPGTCSHFVAKAPWLKPDDSLTVVLNLELDGRRHRVTWNKFVPKQYAHHAE
jgi:hypothetical protein